MKMIAMVGNNRNIVGRRDGERRAGEMEIVIWVGKDSPLLKASDEAITNNSKKKPSC